MAADLLDDGKHVRLFFRMGADIFKLKLVMQIVEVVAEIDDVVHLLVQMRFRLVQCPALVQGGIETCMSLFTDGTHQLVEQAGQLGVFDTR
jgi:hypothetical protein